MSKTGLRFGTVACMTIVVLVSLSGCGSEGGTCTVTGNVMCQGKPVVGGMVNLVGVKGETAVGAIEPDGTYTVFHAPTGVVKVGVVSEKPPPPFVRTLKQGQPAPPPAPDTSKWFPIDAKYADPATSGKEMTLTSGANKQDIVLE